MKKIFSRLANNSVFKANALMVGGNFVANIGAYLFHLMMGRMLVPVDYGALQSLISLSNILNVPLVVLNTVIVKFVSAYVGSDEKYKIAHFYKFLRKTTAFLFVVGGLIFLLFTNAILNFLHLKNWINILFLDFALFFGLIAIVNRATLQGLSQFISLTITQTIDSYGKLIFGVIAVSLGYSVPGAYGSFVLIMVVSYLYMDSLIKKQLINNDKSYKVPIRAIVKYALPSTLMTLTIVSLYNTDVVLVRHFLSASDAGFYSALSVLGKIIFFGAAPVAVTMFPLVSEAHARGDKFSHVFLQSLLYTVLIAAVATFIFSIFPVQSLTILIGRQYLGAAPYLMRFSMFLSLCTIINLYSNYFLSIHKTIPILFTLSGAIAQALLIYLSHDTLNTVINISLTVTFVVTLFHTAYYVYLRK